MLSHFVFNYPQIKFKKNLSRDHYLILFTNICQHYFQMKFNEEFPSISSLTWNSNTTEKEKLFTESTINIDTIFFLIPIFYRTSSLLLLCIICKLIRWKKKERKKKTNLILVFEIELIFLFIFHKSYYKAYNSSLYIIIWKERQGEKTFFFFFPIFFCWEQNGTIFFFVSA